MDPEKNEGSDPAGGRGAAVSVLTEHARRIAAGSYENTDTVFALTVPGKNAPEIAELAESIGLMSVKVEAREFELEQNLHAREEFGRIFISFVLLIGFYTFVVAIISRPAVQARFGPFLFSWAAAIFGVVMLSVAALLIRRSGLPLSSFGVNFHNAGKAIRESLIASAAIIIGFLLFKAWAMANLPSYQGRTLLNPAGYNLFFWFYFLVAPIQEFCTRGVFQGSVERTMTGRRKGLWAIIVTSVMFGSFHTYYSLQLALSSMVASLLWGWLYRRHGTLLGVSLSHLLIGEALGFIDVGLFIIQ